MNRKGSVLVILLMIVIAILIVGGFWYYYSARPASAPTVIEGNQTSTQPLTLPTLSFVTLLPNSTCPQLTAALSNPAIITDVTQFFAPCIIPANIDASSFTIVGSSSFGVWAKDKNGVYFYQLQGERESGGQIIQIQGADPATFTVVPSSSDLYYKDANYVYYFTIQNGANVVTTTPGVDAATFIGIGNNYYQDKNGTYYLDADWNWQKVNGANSSTPQ